MLEPPRCCRHPWNSSKNRYVDVTCLEHSRVQLRSHQHTTGQPTSPIPSTTAAAASGGKAAKTEKQVPIYIHANWVDSYRQRNAFICTQGKLYTFNSGSRRGEKISTSSPAPWCCFTSRFGDSIVYVAEQCPVN